VSTAPAGITIHGTPAKYRPAARPTAITPAMIIVCER
jgi:hypothetical protein